MEGLDRSICDFQDCFLVADSSETIRKTPRLGWIFFSRQILFYDLWSCAVPIEQLRNRSPEKDTGERTLGPCAERVVEKQCFAVPASWPSI